MTFANLSNDAYDGSDPDGDDLGTYDDVMTLSMLKTLFMIVMMVLMVALAMIMIMFWLGAYKIGKDIYDGSD